MAADGHGHSRGIGRGLATFATLALLGALLLQWTSSQLGSEMASLGERLWPGYGVGLREEPTPPLRPEPPAQGVQEQGSGAGPAGDPGVDVDGILGELGGGDEAGDGAVDLDGILGSLEADGAGDGAGEGAGDGAVDLDGILGSLEAGEAGEGAGDVAVDLDGILGSIEVDDGGEGSAGDPDGAQPEKAPRFLTEEQLAANKYDKALAAYDGEVEAYESALERRTPIVRAYAAVDLALLSLFTWLSEHFAPLFILFLGLGGLVATAGRHHISLRPIRSRLDDRVAQAGSMAANLLLIASVVAQYQGRVAAGTEVAEGEGLQAALWVAAFAGMGLVNLVHLLRPRTTAAADEGRGGLGHALMALPLYAVMALLAGVYLLTAEGYIAGLAVYLEKLLANVQLYLQVGLYVWVGMLLKRTRLASLAFAVVRPWRLPPELLAIVVVVLAAIPTAYSGASGIFVIAAGALIFRELTAAGARPSLALASTAMSGSMGVVLSPCLLVVIISYLSPVSSDELFGWGRWVFLLSAALFAGIVVLTRQGSMRPNPSADAWRQSGLALRGLLPHVVIFAAVLLLCRVLLGASLDVNSAAYVLPLALLPMLAYDRRVRLAEERAGGPSCDGLVPAEATVFAATAETSVHVGALLLLMALSAGVGGVIERAEVVALVPAAFASPTLAIAILMVVLVLIGMVMDPYGAVILVQATLSTVAEASGVSLIHFWMVVLVAFELGYLTPPVALNHLLARQVIGDAMPDAGTDAGEGTSLWRRHERYLLPITVMTLTLLLVAFGPILLFGE